MRTYEVLFIVRPDYEEEQIASVIARYQDVISNDQGVVKVAEKWAKRRLAYEIDDFREGLYIIVIFEGTPDIASELDRLMKIDQEVLRHMISRVDDSGGEVFESRKEKPRNEESRPEQSQKGQSRPEVAVLETKGPKEEAQVTDDSQVSN